MREIKFRAWDKRKQEMLSWEQIDVRDKIDAPAFLDMLNDENYVVMQFTGLRDKNGKEIYEGDIGERGGVLYRVTWIEHGAMFGVKVIKTESALVRRLTFPLQHYIYSGSIICDFEVIGNIYENPQLLEIDDGSH